MATVVELVAYGGEATEALAAFVESAKGDDELAPVTVVVRGPLVGLDLRRHLADLPRRSKAGGRGLVNVRLFALARLAELLGAPELAGATADGAEPLTEAALGAALRTALGERPGVLGPVAGHAATEASLAATYRELRQASEAMRRGLGRQSARARDVVRLAERARALLGAGHYDEDDVYEAAARAVRSGAVGIDDVGPVAVHLPERLRPSEVDLLAALGERTELRVLVGLTGDEVVDRDARGLASGLARRLKAPAPVEPAPFEHGHFDEVVSVPDPEAEVREAVRCLLAFDPSGRRLGHCAVAHPGSDRYAHLLARQLDTAGVAWNGPSPGRLAETALGRLLTGFVALALAPVRLDRTEVIAWLNAGPVVTRHGAPVPVGRWDRCSRAAGVFAGLPEWRRRLDAQAAHYGEDPAEARAAADCRQLRTFVEQLDEHLSALARKTSWSELAAAVGASLGALARAPSGPVDDEVGRSVARVLDDLGRLDGLEPLAPLEPAARLERFARSLAASLDTPAPRHGTFGHGVAVAPIGALAGVATDLLVVVGATEGSLPARSSDDPLLPRRERERAAATALLHERPQVRDRRRLLALLAGAGRAVATSPRLDNREGRPQVRSRWLDGDLATGATPRVVRSFAGALVAVAAGGEPAVDRTEYELASLAAWCGADEPAEEHFLVGRVPELAAALRLGRSRASGVLDRFAGDAGATDGRGARLFSPTTLESFAVCPFRGFLGHELEIEQLERPDRRTTIDPRTKGSLVHEVLERFVCEVLADGRSPAPWTAGDRGRLREVALETFAAYEQRGVTGRPVLWELEQRQLLADLDRYLELDAERCAAGGWWPVRAEFSFGTGDVAPLEVPAGEVTVRVRGTIDRIDRDPSGRLAVIDYKTGRSDAFTGLVTDPVDAGRHLQLALYGLAAAEHFGEPAGGGHGLPVEAEYRFVSSRAAVPAVAVTVDATTTARLESALVTLVELIERGTFPVRPGRPDDDDKPHCRSCDFDALCGVGRSHQWAAMRDDARLARFVELVEPTDDAAGLDADDHDGDGTR